MFLVMVLALTACQGYNGADGANGAQGTPGVAGPQGPAGTPAPLPPPPTSIQLLVNAENAYRDAVGQEPLTPGLACTLYTVPTTTTQIAGATLTNVGSFEYLGVFNQPNANVSAGLNVLPASIRSVFTSWYIVKCTGQMVVADDNWHSFVLTSDDGSLLSIGGALINNDGLHAAASVSAIKLMKHGLYSFELDFLQGAGLEQLNLNMDNAVLGAAHFYH